MSYQSPRLYFRHPLPTGAHLLYPWWFTLSRPQKGYRRIDGLQVVHPDYTSFVHGHAQVCQGGERVEAALLRLDTEFPLPAPPPLNRQVWVSGALHAMVGRVLYLPGGIYRVFWSEGDGRGELFVAAHPWPPEKAVLVDSVSCYGQHTFWARAGTVPPESAP